MGSQSVKNEENESGWGWQLRKAKASKRGKLGKQSLLDVRTLKTNKQTHTHRYISWLREMAPFHTVICLFFSRPKSESVPLY